MTEPRRIEPDWPALGPEMAEALEFYARPAAWEGPNQGNDGSDPFTPENEPYIQDAFRDHGNRARTILAKIGGKTG